MRVKRDIQIGVRVSSELLERIKRDAEIKQRSVAGLIHLHLIAVYGDPALPGKEA